MPVDKFELRLTDISRGQAQALYAILTGLDNGTEDLLPTGDSYSGRARAFWTTQREAHVTIRPMQEGERLFAADQVETIKHALEDGAYYRLGEASNVNELEEDEDRDRYLAYNRMLDRLGD